MKKAGEATPPATKGKKRKKKKQEHVEGPDCANRPPFPFRLFFFVVSLFQDGFASCSVPTLSSLSLGFHTSELIVFFFPVPRLRNFLLFFSGIDPSNSSPHHETRYHFSISSSTSAKPLKPLAANQNNPKQTCRSSVCAILART